MMSMKKGLLSIAAAALMLTACAENTSSAETAALPEIKQELAGYEFKGREGLTFACKPSAIEADEVYILTSYPIKEQAADAEAEKMKKALSDLFGISESEQALFKKELRPLPLSGDWLVELENVCGGCIYAHSSNFNIFWHKGISSVPEFDLNMNKHSLYRIENAPTEPIKMADGSSLTVQKAAEQAEGYIKKLVDAGVFGEDFTAKLTRCAVSDSVNGGKAIALHYAEQYLGLTLDDGGFIDGESKEQQLLNPYFEILFIGDDKPVWFNKTYSLSIEKAEKVEKLIPLSEAEKLLTEKLAPTMKADVTEAELRYCSVFRIEDERRICRPMWCFVLKEYSEGRQAAFTPFPKATAYIDAVDGTLYYCDSLKLEFTKTD